MAWGAILGSAIGAAGQIGGGLLSAQGQQTDASDLISSYYNPSLDYAHQATLYDALNQIGWGNLNNVPDPFQEIIGQLQNAGMDSKTRRRATTALLNIEQDPTLLNDPRGTGFTQDQLSSLRQSGVPFGRVVQGGSAAGAIPAGGFSVNGTVPVKNIGRLEMALGVAGLSLNDLQKKLVEQKEFEDKISRLKAAGLPQLAEQMVIDRAKTGATASSLAAAGADYAATGTSQNPLFQALIAQDQRGMNRFATRAGLQANFGGISQAAAQKQISDAELDQNLRVLQNALTTSGLLQATLTPGTQAAQGQNSGQFNAAQIAAQQASAANQLRQGGSANSADSIGNAVGSATSTLGTYFSNLGASKQLNADNVFDTYQYGGYGPGSTQNQIDTANANGSYLYNTNFLGNR